MITALIIFTSFSAGVLCTCVFVRWINQRAVRQINAEAVQQYRDQRAFGGQP